MEGQSLVVAVEKDSIFSIMQLSDKSSYNLTMFKKGNQRKPKKGTTWGKQVLTSHIS